MNYTPYNFLYPIWNCLQINCGHYVVTHLWEVSQYFGHLITSLPTTHIDDDITVGVLGQGLRDDSLTTAKGSRDSCSSTLHTAADQTQRMLFME